MWQIRKLVALILIALFAPAWMSNAPLLVWCLAPSGHNAIELAVVPDHHEPPRLSGVSGFAAKDTPLPDRADSKQRKCVDFVIAQPVQSQSNPWLAAPPPPDPAASVEFSTYACALRDAPRPTPLISLHLAAAQLAQLRTVILLI